MAATEQQKNAIARAFIQTVHVGRRQTAKMDMNDLLTAAGNAYDWIEANRTEYNSILPIPFKTVTTLREKIELFEAAVEELKKVS